MNFLASQKKFEEKFNTNVCICHRGQALIFCNSCGYFCDGRVQTLCPMHPRTYFLMDFSQCPQCRCYKLQEVDIKK